MDAWKAAGRGKPSDDAKMWARFKAAQDQFFAAKNADLEKRDTTMAANLIKREELVVQIEALLPITNVDQAKKALRDLMNAWSSWHIFMEHPHTDRKLESRCDVLQEPDC